MRSMWRVGTHGTQVARTSAARRLLPPPACSAGNFRGPQRGSRISAATAPVPPRPLALPAGATRRAATLPRRRPASPVTPLPLAAPPPAPPAGATTTAAARCSSPPTPPPKCGPAAAEKQLRRSSVSTTVSENCVCPWTDPAVALKGPTDRVRGWAAWAHPTRRFGCTALQASATPVPLRAT